MTADEPPSDSVMKVAMDAATAQFQRMPTSNPWDHARAIVGALAAADPPLLITPEMATLRADLEVQWEHNHYEHCTNDWPHDGTCHWPKPVSLGGDPDEYRAYDSPTQGETP